MLSKKTFRQIFLGLAISGALTTTAQAALPTSGTCGFIGTWSYPFTYMHGSNPGPDWGLNFLGTINFSTSTISLNVILNDPTPLPVFPATERQQQFTAAFTTSTGPISGSSTISFTLSGGLMSLNLLPVNSGNTILIQAGAGPTGAADGGFTGVCQM